MIILSACGNEETETGENTEQLLSEQTTDEMTGIEEGLGSNEFLEGYKGEISHIHGLGYAGNQNAIFFATHDGLKIFDNGNWYKTKGQNNDYMGFNAVSQGFYTSGHPGMGVNLSNPLGLKMSRDNGKSLIDLGFEGESDFHAMGVGYENHTIYVLNEYKNSKMNKGLYVSRDNGNSWKKVQANNLNKKVLSIAVHPTNDLIIAVASQGGILLSEDGGENFDYITKDSQGTSVYFSKDILWYSVYEGDAKLVKYSLQDKRKSEVPLPKLGQDGIIYLAQNPQEPKEVVFATFNGHVFFSTDGASDWGKLVYNGVIQ